MEQAAQVDGATSWQASRKVIVPLAAPGVFTTAILTFFFCWNDFSGPILYTIKVANQDDRAHAFELSVRLDNGETLHATPDHFALAAGEARAITVAVRTDDDEHLPPVSVTRFALHSEDDPDLYRTRTASFLAGEHK